jgi:hypothetical protein
MHLECIGWMGYYNLMDGWMHGWMKHLMSRGTIKQMAYIKCMWSATDGWDTLGMDYVDRMHLECNG